LLLVILCPVEKSFLLTTTQGTEQILSQRVYFSKRQGKQRLRELDAATKNED